MWSRRDNGLVLTLSIAGEPADDLLGMLISFHYKHSLKKSMEVKWKFRNDFSNLLEDKRLFPNQVWRFRFGFLSNRPGGSGGSVSPIKTGIIREVAPDYEDKKTVEITLLDGSMGLTLHSSSCNWGRVPSSTIAIKIAEKYGLKYVVDPTDDIPKQDWMQPGDVNDLQWLRDLAGAIDYEVLFDDSPPVLYYRKKPYDVLPTGTFIYLSDTSDRAFVEKFKPKVKSLGPLTSGAASTDKKATADKSKQALAPYDVEVAGEDGASTVRPGPKGTTMPLPGDAKSPQKMAQVAREQMLDNVHEADSEHPLIGDLKLGAIYKWDGQLDKGLLGRWQLAEINSEISGTKAETKCEWKRNAGNDGKKKNDNSNNKEPGGDSVQVSGDSGDARGYKK